MLVEESCKVCAAAVYFRLKRSVILHNAQHWFIEVYVTGTATLEANLAQHLSRLVHGPLFHFFLDFHKAYGSLYRVGCLEVLRRYGLVTNMARLLANYWYRQRIVPKSGKFFGGYFQTSRGVIQGKPVSHIIFLYRGECGGEGGS